MTAPTLKRDDDSISRQIAALISLDETSVLEKAPVLTIPFFDINIDKASAIVFSFAIVAVLVLWKILGLLDMVKTDNVLAGILMLQIGFFIYQIFESPTNYSSLSIEQSRLVTVEQISSVLLGSMILFIVFMKRIQDSEHRIVMTAILLNSLLFVYLSIGNTGQEVRIARKTKQALLNIIIFLFATAMYLITYVHPVKA